MSERNFIRLLLWAVVLLILGACIYAYLYHSSQKASETIIGNQSLTISTSSPTTSPQNVDWQSLLPEITSIIATYRHAISPRPISVYKEVDVTGDGIPEVIVDSGDGGAHSEIYYLVRLKNSKPELVSFLGASGVSSPYEFLISASAGNGATFNFEADKNTIYQESWVFESTNKIDCEVEAYRWNSIQDKFVYSGLDSQRINSLYCPQIKKQMENFQG